MGLWVRIPLECGCLSVVRVVCCEVEASASGYSVVERSPTDFGVSKSVIVNPRQGKRHRGGTSE